MKKALKIIGIVFGCIILALGIFLSVWFFWPWNSAFFKNAKKEFEIPGLDSAFVPQAFTKIDGISKYIVGGYMSDGSPSRYYVVDKTSGKALKYFTLSIDAKDYTGHACGIASSQDNLWICSKDKDGEGQVYRFNLLDVLDVENKGVVNVIDYFPSLNGADNITVHNGVLWVGEFYRKGNYETERSHKVKTRSGEQNPAVAIGYEISDYADYGLVDAIPDLALSTVGLVQGMTFTNDGKIILSTSYGLGDSNIYSYNDVLSEPQHSAIDIEGLEVPLWFLDNDSLIKKTNARAMTEEIIIDDDKLFILSEAACKKYKLFTRKKVKHVYSLPLDYVLIK